MTKLSPGERAINWAKALAVLCSALVALLGYTNKDKIANWIQTTPSELHTGDTLPADAVAPVNYDIVIKQLLDKAESNKQRIIKLEAEHP